MAEGGAPQRERNRRLFVALAFTDDVRAELKRVADSTRAFAPSGTRWANVDGLHLTLRFIGSTQPDATPALGEATIHAAKNIAPFELSLADAGVFPSRSAPRVLWVGVGGSLDALTGLRDSVECALEAAGLPREERAFAPHVTLARVNARLSRDEAQAVRDAVAALDVRPVTFAVDEVGLYHSDLHPTGAVYTRLASAPLMAGPLS